MQNAFEMSYTCDWKKSTPPKQKKKKMFMDGTLATYHFDFRLDLAEFSSS